MPTLFVYSLTGLCASIAHADTSALPAAASERSTPANTRRFCSTPVLLPALFRDSTETVTTYEASPTYTTTPAQMDYGTQRIKVADGYTEYTVIPAKTQEITEEIEVERERVEIESIPATYRTATKRIKVKEATQHWNPTCTAINVSTEMQRDLAQIPSHCLTTRPAEYRDIQTQVIDIPPRTIKKIIPAKKQSITRKIVLEPAKVIATPVPPVYETIKLIRVAKSASVTTTSNAARTEAIPTQQTTRPERFTTMPALCEAQLNPLDIQQVQHKLQQHGYYQGAIDGIFAQQTRHALWRYQENYQLATGAITAETLQKLGL